MLTFTPWICVHVHVQNVQPFTVFTRSHGSRLDCFVIISVASFLFAYDAPSPEPLNAMAIIQPIPSPIELADRWQRRLFVTSVIFGVAAALIGALLAWLLWGANNGYQEAVHADANARIEEAKRGAEGSLRCSRISACPSSGIIIQRCAVALLA